MNSCIAIELTLQHEYDLTYTLKEQNLNGKVKSVVYTYDKSKEPHGCMGFPPDHFVARRALQYDKNGALLSERTYYIDGRHLKTVVHEYERGRIISSSTYDRVSNPWGDWFAPDGSQPGARDTMVLPRWCETIDYDSALRQVKKQYYHGNSPGSKILTSYTAGGARVDECRLDGTISSSRFYEITATSIKERSYWAKNADMTVFDYDAAGRQTGITEYRNDTVRARAKMRYDDHGNIISSTQFEGDFQFDEYIRETKYSYDTLNNLVKWLTNTHGVDKESRHPYDGIDSMELRYSGYDARGNWLKKSVYREGRFVKSMERTITYYKR